MGKKGLDTTNNQNKTEENNSPSKEEIDEFLGGPLNTADQIFEGDDFQKNVNDISFLGEKDNIADFLLREDETLIEEENKDIFLKHKTENYQLDVEVGEVQKPINELIDNFDAYQKNASESLNLNNLFSIPKEELKNDSNTFVFSEVPEYEVTLYHKYNEMIDVINSNPNMDHYDKQEILKDIHYLIVTAEEFQHKSEIDSQEKIKKLNDFSKEVNEAANKIRNIANEWDSYVAEKVKKYEDNKEPKEKPEEKKDNSTSNLNEKLDPETYDKLLYEINSDDYNEKSNKEKNLPSEEDLRNLEKINAEAKEKYAKAYDDAFKNFREVKDNVLKNKVPTILKPEQLEKSEVPSTLPGKFYTKLNLFKKIRSDYSKALTERLTPEEKAINNYANKISDLGDIVKNTLYLHLSEDDKKEIDKDFPKFDPNIVKNGLKFLDTDDLKKEYNFKFLQQFAESTDSLIYQDFSKAKISNQIRDNYNKINFKNYYFDKVNKLFSFYKKELPKYNVYKTLLEENERLLKENEANKNSQDYKKNKDVYEANISGLKSFIDDFKKCEDNLNAYTNIVNNSALPLQWKKEFKAYEKNIGTLKKFTVFYNKKLIEIEKEEQKKLAEEQAKNKKAKNKADKNNDKAPEEKHNVSENKEVVKEEQKQEDVKKPAEKVDNKAPEEKPNVSENKEVEKPKEEVVKEEQKQEAANNSVENNPVEKAPEKVQKANDPVKIQEKNLKFFKKFSDEFAENLSSDDLNSMLEINSSYLLSASSKELYKNHFNAIKAFYNEKTNIKSTIFETTTPYEAGKASINSIIPGVSVSENLNKARSKAAILINETAIGGLKSKDHFFLEDGDAIRFSKLIGGCVAITNLLNTISESTKQHNPDIKNAWNELKIQRDNGLEYLQRNSFDPTNRIENLVNDLKTTKSNKFEINPKDIFAIFVGLSKPSPAGKMTYQNLVDDYKKTIANDNKYTFKKMLMDDFKLFSKNPNKAEDIVANTYKNKKTNLVEGQENIKEINKQAENEYKQITGRNKLDEYVRAYKKFDSKLWIQKVFSPIENYNLSKMRENLKKEYGYNDQTLDVAKYGSNITKKQFIDILKKAEPTADNYLAFRNAANKYFSENDVGEIFKNYDTKFAFDSIKNDLITYKKLLKKTKNNEKGLAFVDDFAKKYDISIPNIFLEDFKKENGTKDTANEIKDILKNLKDNILGFDNSFEYRLSRLEKDNNSKIAEEKNENVQPVEQKENEVPVKEVPKEVKNAANTEKNLKNIHDKLFIYEKGLKQSYGSKEEFDFVRSIKEKYNIFYTKEQFKELNNLKPNYSKANEASKTKLLFNNLCSAINKYDPTFVAPKLHKDKNFDLAQKMFEYESAIKHLGGDLERQKFIDKAKTECGITYDSKQLDELSKITNDVREPILSLFEDETLLVNFVNQYRREELKKTYDLFPKQDQYGSVNAYLEGETKLKDLGDNRKNLILEEVKDQNSFFVNDNSNKNSKEIVLDIQKKQNDLGKN